MAVERKTGTCKHHGETEYRRYKRRNSNSWHCWQCVKCMKFRHMKNQQRKKAKLIAYFGGKCIKCGYDKYQGALCFHHRDPATKEFSFGGSQRNFEKLLVEAKKCDLLCQNCHYETHHEDFCNDTSQ